MKTAKILQNHKSTKISSREQVGLIL